MSSPIPCSCCELRNLLRILKSKRSVTPNDRSKDLRAFNVVKSIFLQQVDVVAISNGLRISFICTVSHCASRWGILDQEVITVLIAKRLHDIAEHLQIFGMQSDLLVVGQRAFEVVYSIVLQGNAFLG